MRTLILWLFCAMFGLKTAAQIGIGNTDPDPSSILDVRSTSKGMLTPRMSSTERLAIVSPANGLMVFDTTAGSFYYYNAATSVWVRLNGDRELRTNYKLVKADNIATVLAPELAAGGGSKYLLTTNTYYEINGTINLSYPIELNNAYISGLDSGEDKLIRTTGDLFTGTTGGSIRFLTLTASGGNVFNLNGPGAIGSQTQMLIHRDCFMSASQSIGTIQNFGLVFISILQYVGNNNGVVYRNINRLLISNAAWFSNNSGTYEKLEGTFGLVTKQGGFSEVTGTKVGFDVSSNPVISGDAVIEAVVFTGAVTGAGAYIRGYTPAPYLGYNFNNNWTIQSTGVPTERDSEAAGTVYMNRNGAAQQATSPGTGGQKLALNAPVGSNLFRMTNTGDRLTYVGKKGRNFEVSAQLSFDVSTTFLSSDYVFYFVRIPAGTSTPDPQISTEAYADTSGGLQSVGLQGNVFLNAGDSIELYVRRTSGSNNITLRSFTMTVN